MVEGLLNSYLGGSERREQHPGGAKKIREINTK
jgi:hypothetical protein